MDMKYKFCTHCGKKIKASLNFCPYCGTRQKSNKNKKNSYKHKISGKNILKYIGIIVAVCIVIFLLITGCQRHEHNVVINQATTSFNSNIKDVSHWRIGSGKFSDDDSKVNIMMSSDTYDLSANQMVDTSDDSDNSNDASYHLNLNNGVLSVTDLMSLINNDDSFNGSNTNQMIKNSDNGNSVEGTIDINKDDKDLVRGALKTQSNNNFVLFRANSTSNGINHNQFILFERQ